MNINLYILGVSAKTVDFIMPKWTFLTESLCLSEKNTVANMVTMDFLHNKIYIVSEQNKKNG